MVAPLSRMETIAFEYMPQIVSKSENVSNFIWKAKMSKIVIKDKNNVKIVRNKRKINIKYKISFKQEKGKSP